MRLETWLFARGYGTLTRQDGAATGGRYQSNDVDKEEKT